MSAASHCPEPLTPDPSSRESSRESSVQDDILSRGIATLAGDICLQVGPALLELCRPVEFVQETRPFAESAATWLCERRAFFTLIKEHSNTLVFSHSNQVLYYASPEAQLSRSCPHGVALLCQFTMDRVAATGGVEPRLLVFDVLSCPRGTPAFARGEHLRSLSVHLHQPLCCVQWVGLGRYLTRGFVAGLPHPVVGLCQVLDEPGKLGIARGI